MSRKYKTLYRASFRGDFVKNVEEQVCSLIDSVFEPLKLMSKRFEVEQISTKVIMSAKLYIVHVSKLVLLNTCLFLE